MTVKRYDAIPYLTKGDIRIIFKEPNVVGLYTETNFVFDPIKAYLFDFRGILNIKKDDYKQFDYDNFKNMIKWYQNAE